MSTVAQPAAHSKIYFYDVKNMSNEQLGCHVDLSKIVAIDSTPMGESRVFFKVYTEARGGKGFIELYYREEAHAALVAAWVAYHNAQ